VRAVGLPLGFNVLRNDGNLASARRAARSSMCFRGHGPTTDEKAFAVTGCAALAPNENSR
jgi:hypothetical protein